MAAKESTPLLASMNSSTSGRLMRSVSRSGLYSENNELEIPEGQSRVPVCGSYRLFVAVMAMLAMIACFATQASMSSAMVCMLKDDTVSNSTNQTGDSTQDGSVWLFDWDKDTQGWILSSLYIGYYVSQIPSGIAAARFGPKRVIVVSMVATSILQVLTVPATRAGLAWLITTRVITGFVTGFLYAPIFSLVGFWAPSFDISLLFGIAGMGLELGNTVSFGASMAACEIEFQSGWPLIFYFLALFGLVVAVILGVFVSDSPFENRFISETEVGYISAAIPRQTEKNKEAVSQIPVKKIVTSMPVWAITVSQLGTDFFYYMLINSLPMYFKDVIHLSELEVNLLSGLPFLATIPTIYLAGLVSDRLVVGGKISMTTCRKINDGFCKMLPAVLMVAIGFIPEGSTALAFVLNVLCSMGMAFAYVAWLANPVDLAPAYTGFIMGFSEMGAVWVSIVVPIIVNDITEDKTRSSWQLIFFITSGLQVVSYIFYLIFASGELQSWAVSTYTKDYGSLSLDRDENETTEEKQIGRLSPSFGKLLFNDDYPNIKSEEKEQLPSPSTHSLVVSNSSDSQRTKGYQSFFNRSLEPGVDTAPGSDSDLQTQRHDLLATIVVDNTPRVMRVDAPSRNVSIYDEILQSDPDYEHRLGPLAVRKRIQHDVSDRDKDTGVLPDSSTNNEHDSRSGGIDQRYVSFPNTNQTPWNHRSDERTQSDSRV